MHKSLLQIISAIRSTIGIRRLGAIFLRDHNPVAASGGRAQEWTHTRLRVALQTARLQRDAVDDPKYYERSAEELSHHGSDNLERLHSADRRLQRQRRWSFH